MSEFKKILIIFCITSYGCRITNDTLEGTSVIFTARKRSLGQGNVFTPVCHSVHRGSLSGGGEVCPGGLCLGGSPAGGRVSVQGGLCPGVVSAQGGGSVCPGGLCLGGLCPEGSLPRGISVQGGRGSVQEDPTRMVKSGRYASYWNAFLLFYHIFITLCLKVP